MNRLDEIVVRKQQLLAESDAGRNEMARVYYLYQARTLMARQAASFFKNPLVLAGLGIFALKMPWRRAYKLGGWAWRGWRLLRTIRRFVM
ncbi:MAG TPA: hypothetical protein VK633_02365 [Verrucomicrobiae bacterium]|nr:hypothetical protein [Verrucomicrobiae bacterium]